MVVKQFCSFIEILIISVILIDQKRKAYKLVNICLGCNLWTWTNPSAQVDEAAEVGEIAAEDGSLLTVQCCHSHTTNVLLHPGSSLACMHLVCHSRERALAQRQGLEPQ